MNEVEKNGLIREIHKVFVPGTPISTFDLFRGRNEQITDVLGAIQQPGRHVILFGERGVGKTSLAKTIVDMQRLDRYRTLETSTINCDESDDFSSLWHKVFCALPFENEHGETVYVDSLMFDSISPDNVRFGLSRLKEPSVIVIDEVDQLKDAEAKSLLTATIKNLSDHSVNTTLILVGVGDTVNDLIVEKKSAERALAQVWMQRMSPNEIALIVDRGVERLKMTIDPSARDWIIRLSQGLPYYTHFLALYAGLSAIYDERRDISMKDVTDATVKVVHKAQNVRYQYHKATRSPQRSNLYAKALLACALTETNQLGFFSAADVVKWMSVIAEKPYTVAKFLHYLVEFCQDRRGPVLFATGEKRRRQYRFIDPLMQPYVVIDAVGKGEINITTLETSRPEKVSDDDEWPQDEELPF